MKVPFTIPLPDMTKVNLIDGGDVSCEISDKRDFTRKVNVALIALQDAQESFKDWHPDSSGNTVAEHNIEILSDLIPAFCDLIEDLACQVVDHGHDGFDEFDSPIEELKDMLSWWQKRI